MIVLSEEIIVNWPSYVTCIADKYEYFLPNYLKMKFCLLTGGVAL